MFISDLLFIFTWWAVFLLIGIIFLPFTTRIFSSFLDKGYTFSKILGVLGVSYIVFFLGTIKLLPFSQINLIVILILLGIASIFLLRNFQKEELKAIKSAIKIFAFEEFLFFAGLLFWSYIRAHEPSIHGLEKYMDVGFVNSILRAEYFPAKDLWLAPFSINYYYFGHLITAVLTKLSGIDVAITYNLMIATLFAFTFTGAFSLGLNLIYTLGVKKLRASILSGLLAGFLVALGGNLHTTYAFFTAYNGDNPVPFWTLPLKFDLTGYWYPNATRFIPFTIHEFPIYSFVVSDLHGHVLSIPIVLTIIAVLLSLIQNPKFSVKSGSASGGKMKNDNKKFKIFNFQPQLFTFNFLLLTLLAFLLATAYMTNAWDGLIYAGLTGFVFAYLAHKQNNNKFYVKRYALIIVGAILFSLPFSLYFKPFVSGIGVVCAPDFLIKLGKLGPFLFEQDKCGRSPLWQFLILWGFFYFFVISFFIFLRGKKLMVTDVLVLILIFLSTLLLIFPEFFYAKDIYPAHYRANTMFKLGYQAFMMLGISSAYIIARLVTSNRLHVTRKFLLFPYVLLATCLVLLVGIYPYFAINGYYGNLKIYRGIDGLAYLRDLYPTDYDGILWIQKHIVGQPVILEGSGESYTDYARISANTGLPTVVGWPVHEWLWRGSYDEAGKRVTEVEQIYTTADLEQAKTLLIKHHVTYVFIGTLERQKYQKLAEEKFKIFGTPIYQNGQTIIYQLHNYL